MALEDQEMNSLRHLKGHSHDEAAEVEAHSDYDKDQAELARTGKKQVLKVNKTIDLYSEDNLAEYL